MRNEVGDPSDASRIQSPAASSAIFVPGGNKTSVPSNSRRAVHSPSGRTVLKSTLRSKGTTSTCSRRRTSSSTTAIMNRGSRTLVGVEIPSLRFSFS